MKTKSTALVGLLALLVAGCGTQVHPSHPTSKAKPVHVVYAGSLAYINDQVVGPAFQKASGITYQGHGGGSYAMAQDLSSHLFPGDVFESIGTGPIAKIVPKETRWAVRIASTPLVIAYNPHSRYAGYFKEVATGQVPLKAFFQFIASHQVHLGRTNPATDPQGQAFYWMVELAAARYGLPTSTVHAILGAWNNPSQIYSEEGILTELQSGGLDLASAFLPEAKQRHLDYIPLPVHLNFSDPTLNPWYHQASISLPTGTVSGSSLAVWATVLQKSPSGTRFVSYLLDHEKTLKPFGYSPLPAVIWGRQASVPKAIHHD